MCLWRTNQGPSVSYLSSILRGSSISTTKGSQAWQLSCVISALKKQLTQACLHKFKASLGFIETQSLKNSPQDCSLGKDLPEAWQPDSINLSELHMCAVQKYKPLILAEREISMSLGPAWSMYQVPVHQELHSNK